MHLKNFLEWIGIKAKLDSLESPVPYVSRGQIWWASLGENVGFEINGKNEFFTRPVIIYRKLAHGFYFVIPTTTKPKIGTWYVPFKQKGVSTVACLHQARAIDYRRLHRSLGEVDDVDFARIRKGFLHLYD